MASSPIITFKAGKCEVDQSSKPYKVKAVPTPGYIYLYYEDDLVHFCWRPRDAPATEPETDLVMIPTDGHFVPYDTRTPAQPTSKTNGRIFVLKFGSSSQRHLFWLQSKAQGRNGDAAWLSPRDRKIGDIVNRLLQGEEVDVTRELAAVRNNNDDSEPRRDEDEAMEDVEGHGGAQGGAGGAGADATGGDVRQEGEEAREGGADGARAAAGSAAVDAAAAVRNFLESLKGTPGFDAAQPQGKAYPLLNDLLDASVTIQMVKEASDSYLDNLLSLLPPTIVVLSARGAHAGSLESEPTPDDAAAARAAMNRFEKEALLNRVLRSPQFNQSLLNLSMALRDGGLPGVSEALGVKVDNGGLVRGGNVPLGGGEAIEAFVEGVKKAVQEE